MCQLALRAAALHAAVDLRCVDADDADVAHPDAADADLEGVTVGHLRRRCRGCGVRRPCCAARAAGRRPTKSATPSLSVSMSRTDWIFASLRPVVLVVVDAVDDPCRPAQARPRSVEHEGLRRAWVAKSDPSVAARTDRGLGGRGVGGAESLRPAVRASGRSASATSTCVIAMVLTPVMILTGSPFRPFACGLCSFCGFRCAQSERRRTVSVMIKTFRAAVAAIALTAAAGCTTGAGRRSHPGCRRVREA